MPILVPTSSATFVVVVAAGFYALGKVVWRGTATAAATETAATTTAAATAAAAAIAAAAAADALAAIAAATAAAAAAAAVAALALRFAGSLPSSPLRRPSRLRPRSPSTTVDQLATVLTDPGLCACRGGWRHSGQV
jgi:hypothetical protein